MPSRWVEGFEVVLKKVGGDGGHREGGAQALEC